MPKLVATEVVPVLLDLAGRQHGVVTRAQLAALGLSDKAVARLGAQGWIRRVRKGVFAIGGRAPSRWEQVVALALVCGDGSTISHATAAAIHRIPGVIDGPVVELTVVVSRHPRPATAVVHRVRRMDPLDVQLIGGIAVTTAARTLVDLSSRFDPVGLAHIIDEGRIAGLWTIDDLLDAVGRAGPQPGIRALRTLLVERSDEPSVDSMFEERVVRALRSFPPFETRHQVVLDGASCPYESPGTSGSPRRPYPNRWPYPLPPGALGSGTGHPISRPLVSMLRVSTCTPCAGGNPDTRRVSTNRPPIACPNSRSPARRPSPRGLPDPALAASARPGRAARPPRCHLNVSGSVPGPGRSSR